MKPQNASVENQTAISLRPMNREDLPAASGLSKALSWPHRLEDWESMFRLGQGLVATLDSGEIIGTILWWPFNDRYATLGLIIVSNAWQGHGIGTSLLTTVRRLLPGYSLCLNATVAGQPLYEKFGFIPTGIVEQHQGTGVSAPIVALEAGQRIRPVVQYDLDEISAIDASSVGMNRFALMEELVSNAKGIVIDMENGIRGYSFCRRFGWGWVIGPVAAQSVDEARALIAHWIGVHGGEFIRIDIPASCGLSFWLDEMGLTKVDAVNTMSTDPVPFASEAPQYFALSSQAIG